MNPAQNVEKIAPLRKSVTVKRSPEEAFEIFTGRLASWWPLQTHSIFEAEAATCGIEPRVGGNIFETSRSGERREWGTILAWEPPRRFVTTWHPGQDPATATEVEVSFTAVPGGTRVDLEHRDWEKLGAMAAKAREGYNMGWVEVFDRRFVEGCA